MRTGELSPEAEGAVTVAALAAAGRFDRLHEEAQALVARGLRPADLREAAYVASLFFGFPRGVAALATLADALGTSGEGDVHRDRPARDRDRLHDIGLALFHQVHQGNADRQLRMLEELHADFAETVLAEAYGRVMARSFLSLPVRELVGVAVLAVLGLKPQMRAHLLGAHNAGASWATIGEAVERACLLAGVDPGEARAAAAALAEKPRR